MKRPVFIARQSARPSGLIGRVIAGVMARETSDLNEHAVRLLGPSPFDRVLEVGFGHGRTIERLASVVNNGRVCGIDASELMLNMAVRRNFRDIVVAPPGYTIVEFDADSLTRCAILIELGSKAR